MKLAGIIAEYNPFHSGHKYHITRTKELTGADGVVCAISSSFVQRGEPAIIDKWNRAHMALLGGADMVIELPFCYSAQSASYFASGGVRLLSALNIDYLSFGCETDEIDTFNKVADILLNESYDLSQTIQNELALGNSFPVARSNSLKKIVHNDFLSMPNNILALEYIMSIKKYNLNITPIIVKRMGTNYNDYVPSNEYISASGARNLIFNNRLLETSPYIPEDIYLMLQNLISTLKYTDATNLDNYILGLIRHFGASKIKEFPYVSEGLENRLYESALNSSSVKEMLGMVKTKRYTYTRLLRILINMAVGLKNNKLQEYIEKGPAYIRVLGANEKGQRILKEAKKTCSLPILTKSAHYKRMDDYAREMFELELRASSIYELSNVSECERYAKKDFLNNPVIIK